MKLTNDKLEKDVLSYIMFNSQKCIDLKQEHFVNQYHKNIFNIIKKLYIENKKINIYTILDEDRTLQLEFLEELMNVSSQFESINTLIDFHKRREIYLKTQYLIKNLEKEKDLNSFIARYNESLNQTIKNEKKEFKTMKELIEEAIEDIEKSDAGTLKKFWTGYKNIDEKMCGLEGGNLHIIAGRPSVGKTTFAISYVTNLALAGEKIFVKSLETQGRKLVKKIIENLSEAPLKTFKCDEKTLNKLGSGVAKSYDISNNIIFCENYNSDIDFILYQIREYKIKYDINIVLIDHMQLVNSKAYQERRLQIGDISRKLKTIANELNIHIIALSQLSRAVEQRTDKRPMLSDLRESGDIEQDADLIALLYREDYYNNNSQQSVAPLLEVIYAKNREGETFKSFFIFQKNIAKFKIANGIDGF